MNNKIQTTYKLMILYMLSKVSFMLNYAQLSEFFLSKNYLGYIELKTMLVELLDSNLISQKLSKTKEKYKITNAGTEALNYFLNDIPLNYIIEINNYLEKNKIKLRTEASVISEINEIENNSYKIHLEINETNSMLLDIDMEIPDIDTATTMCENWKENAKDIYNYIIKKLI